MALRSGSSIGPYSILEKLGAGGMGEVWKARDTRLGRIVALKCLPGEKISDQDRRQRFLREAQAASALNHPNIVTVHDWTEDGGGSYVLVMEYVPGRTLDRLIGPQGLPLPDTFAYATQIASALAAAHASGIVHSDIKPANIMIADQGRVKVLDFGLAKLTDHAHLGPDEATLTAGPVTAEGTVAGTAPYMSPEQAEGKKLDARSDIFSFGAVLYEMATGRRAFEGDSRASQMAAVLKSEPLPPSQITGMVPRELERIIMRCLRKDIDRRSQSMAEIALELEELKGDSTATLPAISAAKHDTRRPWTIAAAIAVIVAAAGGWFAIRQREAPPPVYRVRQITSSGTGRAPAVSPDGKLIVYLSNRGGQPDLWIQPLTSGEPVRLTNTRSPESGPMFSPDGSLIYFRRGGGVYAIPPIGGGERAILNVPEMSGFAISADGKNIAYGAPDPSLSYVERRVWIIPSAGGAARRLDIDPMWLTRLLWSPDGTQLLAAVPEHPANIDYAPAKWLLAPVRGGPAKKVEGLDQIHLLKGERSVPLAWLADGRIILATVGDTPHVWSVKIGADGRVGRPVQLTNCTGEFPGQPSADGRVIPFVNGSGALTLYQFQLGNDGASFQGEPRRLLDSDGDAFFPVTTADGKKMVFISTRMGNPDIWMRDMDTGAETALVATPERETRAVISPDGTRLAFQRSYGGGSAAFWMTLPHGNETKFCDNCWSLMGWTPDSKGVIVYTGKPEQMMIYEISSGKYLPTVVHPNKEVHDMTFSPDGHWLAFKVVESGDEHHVYVSPYAPGRATGPGEWTRISGNGRFSRPFWSTDGNILYYFSGGTGSGTNLLAQRLDAATRSPKGDPVTVKTFGRDLILPTAQYIGYALTGNRLILPLGQSHLDVWVAEQEH